MEMAILQVTGDFEEINDELMAKVKDNILLGILKINKYNEAEKNLLLFIKLLK
ncbi:hypothetical protein J8J04_00385 ['Fragaria x ananassa' phyllody phytoplasma]|uniref:Uncharacterized protein n=1 Tax='Fragaria x ananassa' phyllody phytoplasma TaxID=2358428 RepID=A0ABS5K542_9MOLU|nr:hypothetical protein ['Fragaria x ananassa' phyllody phytoplasma]MBS2126180.1 hypothetical protein ['Fragaria x ananassa' phyllody phytoplasma]